MKEELDPCIDSGLASKRNMLADDSITERCVSLLFFIDGECVVFKWHFNDGKYDNVLLSVELLGDAFATRRFLSLCVIIE